MNSVNRQGLQLMADTRRHQLIAKLTLGMGALSDGKLRGASDGFAPVTRQPFGALSMLTCLCTKSTSKKNIFLSLPHISSFLYSTLSRCKAIIFETIMVDSTIFSTVISLYNSTWCARSGDWLVSREMISSTNMKLRLKLEIHGLMTTVVLKRTKPATPRTRRFYCRHSREGVTGPWMAACLTSWWASMPRQASRTIDQHIYGQWSFTLYSSGTIGCLLLFSSPMLKTNVFSRLKLTHFRYFTVSYLTIKGQMIFVFTMIFRLTKMFWIRNNQFNDEISYDTIVPSDEEIVSSYNQSIFSRQPEEWTQHADYP